jgi:YfiH family protein
VNSEADTDGLLFIKPDWPAPANVRALTTTRTGGMSQPPWQSLNLGDHVSDNPAHVTENRQRLADTVGLAKDRIAWIRQVHGTHVARFPGPTNPEADASASAEAGLACAILTADCLPVVFCNTVGSKIAAAHAGWRGLCNGILENTAREISDPEHTLAWLGPAIGPDQFEVGPEVREAFLAHNPKASTAFKPSPNRPDHYLADIYQLARQRLNSVGITRIYGGTHCTVTESDRFYSYRRDGTTGRMATLIWLVS